mmetsp:Transcript_30863/g.52213  ORF Transcript_30863/g.52213 Transcript_30863/m.52213 type:complete len:239 (-) Transcript_30863:368-1084(-)
MLAASYARWSKLLTPLLPLLPPLLALLEVDDEPLVVVLLVRVLPVLLCCLRWELLALLPPEEPILLPPPPLLLLQLVLFLTPPVLPLVLVLLPLPPFVFFPLELIPLPLLPLLLLLLVVVSVPLLPAVVLPDECFTNPTPQTGDFSSHSRQKFNSSSDKSTEPIPVVTYIFLEGSWRRSMMLGRSVLMRRMYSMRRGTERSIGSRCTGSGSLPAQDIPSPRSKGLIGSVRNRSFAYAL